MVADQQCRPGPKKVIKDPIHEYVELPEDFVATAVDRRIFQRLRWIAQLSMNLHVYPGTTHTRFEHSLGVAYVMLQALNHLRDNMAIHVLNGIDSLRHRNQNLERDVLDALYRLLERVYHKLGEYEKEAVTAALYHDIGHIMLSHAAESGIRDRLLYKPPFALKIPSVRGMHHEQITLTVVWKMAKEEENWEKGQPPTLQGLERANPYSIYYNCERVNLSRVHTILEIAYVKDTRRKYCRPVRIRVGGNSGRQGRPTIEEFIADGLDEAADRMSLCIIASLLSSNVDVDRADYILRDSHHSGSKAGAYDIDRYYSVLTVVPRVNRISRHEYEVSLRLGVLDKGVATVENILLSRIYLYKDLYLHDISMIYGSMAARLFSLLLYASKIIESKEDQAEEVFERFPLLRSLARFPVEISTPGSFPRLEAYLDRLTDHEFFSLAKRLSSSEFRLFARVFREAASGDKHLTGEMVDRILLSIGLLSKGLTERKHWSGLLLTGDPATRIIGMLRDEENGINEEVKRFIDPLVMLDFATYVAYKRGTPDDDTKEIYVYYRCCPLESTDITRSRYSIVVDKIADTAYSKIIITYPPGTPRRPDEPPLELWTLREGKPRPYQCRHPCTGSQALVGTRPRDFIEPVASMAGLSWEEAWEMIWEAAGRAWSLARLLESRVPGG